MEQSLQNIIKNIQEKDIYISNLYLILGGDFSLIDNPNKINKAILNKYEKYLEENDIIIFFTEEYNFLLPKNIDYILVDKKKDYIEITDNIYVCPYFLPQLKDTLITETITQVQTNKKYKKQINLNLYQLITSKKEFPLKLLTILFNFCQNVIINHGSINIINEYFFNTTEFINGQSTKRNSNQYFENIMYVYLFFLLFNDNINQVNLGHLYENLVPNYHKNIMKVIEFIDNQFIIDKNIQHCKKLLDLTPFPSKIKIQANDKKKTEKTIKSTKSTLIPTVSNEFRVKELKLDNYFIGDNDEHKIIELNKINIPVQSLDTARGRNWLDSYAIITGMNYIIHKYNDFIINRLGFKIAIPELQYTILNHFNENMKRELSRNNLLIIPINIEGIHWTLLIIDNINNKSYHINSLSVSDENNKIADFISIKLIGTQPKLINLKDQKNSYDCGIFIIFHFEFILNKTSSIHKLKETIDKLYELNEKYNIKYVFQSIRELREKITNYSFNGGNKKATAYANRKKSNKNKLSKRNKNKLSKRNKNK